MWRLALASRSLQSLQHQPVIRITHPANELGEDTSQSHVLEQEQIQLIGVGWRCRPAG